MDLRRAAVGAALDAIASLPSCGNASEVAALEKLMADIESGTLKGDRKLRANTCHDEGGMKNKTNDKAMNELQQEVELLQLRVRRRDEAIRELHRRLAIEVVQVQKGSDQSRQEARTRCREQEDDSVQVAVALRERIVTLEAALQSTREELDQARQRAGAEHVKLRAQVERNEQLSFDFTEKLRSLEYEKKSSVVILAAKDRIVERSQEEIVAMQEKHFVERKRVDKLLADLKKLEKQREDELIQSEKDKAAAEGVREELERTRTDLAAQADKSEALSEENAALQKKYAELWRRLDSDGAPPPIKSTASPPKNNNGKPTMAHLLEADTGVSESDDSGDDGSSADIKVKLLSPDFKSSLNRKRLGKSKGRSVPRGSTLKPSDLILQHKSLSVEGYDDDDQSDCSGINLARIGLAIGRRSPNGPAIPGGSPDAGDMRSKYTKSILGTRREIKPDVTAKGKKSKKISTPSEPTDAPAAPSARPKSAIGAFAQSWAHSGGRQAASTEPVRPSTSPRPDGVVPAPETNDPDNGEVDHFPLPDEVEGGKEQYSTKKAPKRKKSRRYSSLQSPSAKKSPKQTLLNDFSRNSPIPSESDSGAERTAVSTSKTTGMFRKTKLTVKTAVPIVSAPSDDNVLQVKVQALQVALEHQQTQLGQEQKYFTAQIVKLKTANESLTEQVVDLEQRLSTDHKELCHERDELHRTVTFLSEQLAVYSSTHGPAQSPAVVGHGLNQVSSQSSFRGNRAQSMSWDIPLAIVPEVTPPNPVETLPQTRAEDLNSLRASSLGSAPSTVPTTAAPTIIHLRDTSPAVTEALASPADRAHDVAVAPAGRRKGKVGSSEIYVPIFGDVPTEVVPDPVLEHEANSKVQTSATVVAAEDTAQEHPVGATPGNENVSSSPPPAEISTLVQNRNRNEELSAQGDGFLSFPTNPPAAALDQPVDVVLVDASAGEDTWLPTYQDACCQWEDDECDIKIDDNVSEQDIADSLTSEALHEIERRNERLLLNACKEMLEYEESTLANLFQSLLKINEATRASASSCSVKLEEFVDAGMAVRYELCNTICDTGNMEALRNLRIIIRCLDAIFIQIRTLLYRDDREHLNLSHSNSLVNDVEQKEFFYRGSSIRALLEVPVVNQETTIVSEKIAKPSDTIPSTNVPRAPLRSYGADDLDSYDIWKVYDFVSPDENGTPAHVEYISREYRSSGAPDILARSNSPEINIHFPVVKALVPSEPSSRRASFISNPMRLRAASIVEGPSAARTRSRSLSPVVDAPIFSFSKILYGDPLPAASSRGPHTSGCSTPENTVSERVSTGAGDLNFTTTRLTPTAPVVSRTAASMTSPRPKSALAHSRKQSYKLDAAVDAGDDMRTKSETKSAKVDRPVTAPEKKVAFNLENDSEHSMASPSCYEPGGSGDEDAESIYRRLMADFEKHISATLGDDFFTAPGLHESLEGPSPPRRRHTNIYRDGLSAFRTSDGTTTVSVRRNSELLSPKNQTI